MKLAPEQLRLAIVANRLQLEGHLSLAAVLVEILRHQCAAKGQP